MNRFRVVTSLYDGVTEGAAGRFSAKCSLRVRSEIFGEFFLIIGAEFCFFHPCTS
jgi:hypothetical protein